jgi:hypothetical protein
MTRTVVLALRLVGVGFLWVIPTAGAFGYVWTAVLVSITFVNLVNLIRLLRSPPA